MWLEFMTGNTLRHTHSFTYTHKYTIFNVLNLTAIPAVQVEFVNYILITSLKVAALKCPIYRQSLFFIHDKTKISSVFKFVIKQL